MIYGYPQPGKPKSGMILSAFLAGAGGELGGNAKLKPGAAAFYGTVGIEQILFDAKRRAEQGGDPFFYLDNAYFDCARGRYFRASRNALQRAGARADYQRADRLGIVPQPWRRDGGYVLVVEQSDYFMRHLGGYPAGLEHWRDVVLRRIAAHTDRDIRVRSWQRDKLAAALGIKRDLAGAWCVVTHASAAAVEAVLAGVPVFLTGQSVALEMGLSDLSAIERPRRPDGRREWAARLAASQWTLDEMRAGMAWRALTEELATQ